MSIQEYFSEDYVSARAQFLKACESQRLEVEQFEHPLSGPGGETLTTEAVLIGPQDATSIVVLISGVHGVEALCGSACQTGWLTSNGPEQLPADTAVLLIHMINCWGAAHRRRNTDGNIDLCRNFIDFDQALPENDDYPALHEAVICSEYRGAERDKAERIITAYVEQNGMDSFIDALMGGQYRYPDGFSFGGSQATWSNRTLLEILRRSAGKAQRVVTVEYHTGLGPYAYGTAVTMHSGRELVRARQYFGHWILAPNEHEDGTETFHTVRGHTTEGYVNVLSQAEVTSIVLEYGTYPPQQSLPVMLDDHWLTLHGDIDSEEGHAIKDSLLALHYPRDPDWRQAIWDRSQQVIAQAYRGLAP